MAVLLLLLPLLLFALYHFGGVGVRAFEFFVHSIDMRSREQDLYCGRVALIIASLVKHFYWKGRPIDDFRLVARTFPIIKSSFYRSLGANVGAFWSFIEKVLILPMK